MFRKLHAFKEKGCPWENLTWKVTAFDQGEIFKGLSLKNHKSIQVECSNGTIIQVSSRSLMQWIEQEFHSLLWAELYPFSKIKSEHWRTDAFKLWSWRRLLSPLDYKEIKPVSPKENQPWIFIGRTDAEAEALIFWLPDAKSQLIRKDPCGGKNKVKRRGQQKMRQIASATQCIWVEQTLGDSRGQKSLACCSPWNHKELDMT